MATLNQVAVLDSNPKNDEARARVGPVTIRHGSYSLLCLSEQNFLRRGAKFIVESRAFDIFILATIIANCVVLALDAPLPNNDKSSISDELERSEIFFLVIFTLEAILKIIALGFVFHPGSYLRNGWNILDFIVVITGFISLRQLGNDDVGDVKPIRAIRVLRPLKLVSGTPSLQVVMKSIMRAMVPLLQVLVLTMFVIVIYATVGLSFLVDKFHATCFNNVTGKEVPLGSTVQPCDYQSKPGMFTGRQCNASNNEVCRKYWIGPNNGISTYDNIVLAILTVSQCITMEGWTDVMYSTFYAADSDSFFYTIYYVSLILIGSFFMLNLVLGVLSGEFAKERERVETRRNFFKLRREQKINREVEQYLEWISRAEEIIVEDLVTRQNDTEAESCQLETSPANFVFNPISVLAVDGGQVPRLNLAERHKRFPKFRLKERLLRIRVRRLVKHSCFFWGVLIVVLLNTISLATEHYNQPQWLTDFQNNAEIVFQSIFVLEMLLKIYGLGPTMYFRSTFNAFDFVVIIFGLVEMMLKKQLGISVLRCLRLLRIFKMTSYWSGLRNLVRSLVSSIKSILSLIFLLFLFVVIFSLLGMQFFGGKFISETERPRTNFDDFPNAMLAVFQILTGEDWNSVMYEGIKAYGGAKEASGLACGLYFVLLVIIGNYTLLNVFLAIAVDNLANAHVLTQDEENERLEREAKSDQHGGSERTTSSRWHDIGSVTKTLALVKSWTSSPNPSTDESNCDANGKDNSVNGSSSKEQSRKVLTKSLLKNINRYRKEIGDDRDVEAQHPDQNEVQFQDINRRRSEGQAVKRTLKGRRKSKVRKLKKKVPIIRTKALFLFGPENKFRRACHYIVNLRHFDNFMLVVIICSSILLAIEDPVNDGSKRNKVIRYFDYIFTSIFAFEVFVKLIDLGAVLHPGSYFRSKWNFIDALVVCCNIASLVLSKTNSNVSGQSIVNVLRVLRVFRPLKMMNKLKKLEAVFRCMWYSFKNVANILLITFLFLFIFAVIGVQLFQGKFFYCTDRSKMYERECKGSYFEFNQEAGSIDRADQTKIKERVWQLRDFHFNNVFSAMLTLYTSATGEGWPSAMQHTMDVTDVDKGPIRNYNVENALFYISFVVVFSFFFLNIFVALVILTFQEQGEKELVNSELDRNQRDCISFVVRAKPSETFMPADKNTWSYRVWCIVVSKPFELFIMGLIILNTVVLMMEYNDQPEDYENMCDYFNAALTFLFTMEAALKLFAFKLSYFRDSWNVFDFIVVVGSILDISLTFGNTFDLPFDPSMFRVFRAARLIKILKQGAGIRVLLWTFLQSFKALPYVTLLIFLVFFIYAVIGMQIFGKIKLDDSTQINKYNNFQDIVKSLLLLFRSMTGENWQEIMLSCYDSAECDARASPMPDSRKCGSTNWAIPYFCTFIFLCMFFMLNLFVAVIMDNFEYLTRDQSILGPHHLDEFVQIWSVYDPAATGKIHYSKLYEMMTRLSPPVGFGKKCPKIVAYKRLIKMNMPLNDDDETIHFTTTLFALVRTSLKIRVTGNMNANDTKLRNMITEDWPKAVPIIDIMIPKHSVLSCQQMTVGKIYCAKLMVENHRLNKKRQQFDILDDEELRKQKPGSIIKRLVGSVSRSMRMRGASSVNGLVPTEDNTQHEVDKAYQRDKGESLTMEDLRRSSSCHNFSSGKAKRRQELNSSPFIKRGIRATLSASSSPQASRRKLKVSAALSLPLTSDIEEDRDERLNHVPSSSKHKGTKINFDSSRTTTTASKTKRPQFQQTPSIVINSPSNNNRRAVNLTDITLEHPSNVGKILPGKEADDFSQHAKELGKDTREKTYCSKQTSPILQQDDADLSASLYKEKEPYSKFPYMCEMYRDGVPDDEVDYSNRKSRDEFSLVGNYRDSQRHGARGAEARNVGVETRDAIPKARSGDIGARNISPGARIVSPGAHNGELRTRKSSAEARNVGLGTRNVGDDDERSDRGGCDYTKTSPSIFSVRIENPEVFQKPRATYVGQDLGDGNYLYKQKDHYFANSVTAANKHPGENNTNQEIQATAGKVRQSRSEFNLKSTAERPVNFVTKTFSDPTGLPADQVRIGATNSPITSLGANNTQPQSPGVRENGPLARRKELENKERNKNSDRQLNRQMEKDRFINKEKHNADTIPSDRSKFYSKVDQQSLQTTKQPSERKHISLPAGGTLPNSGSTGGRKNETFQTDEATGPGRQNVNHSERAREEIFGGLLGDTDAKHSAEYYDRMINKINEQINLAVSRNKSHYAMYGLGSDDDDDWC